MYLEIEIRNQNGEKKVVHFEMESNSRGEFLDNESEALELINLIADAAKELND